MLITLVEAQVRLKTPVEINPLGIPLVIARPNLLTVALVFASIYATLRFIYYGMLAQPSPMRARRELPKRIKPAYVGGADEMAKFHEEVQKEVDRHFPSFGKHKVTFGTRPSAGGWSVVNMHIPDAVRVMSWIDTVDFLLPIIANAAALGIWLNGGLTMSVGTGLFLGLLCLAVVLLYTQTKDSGRWRRLSRWIGGLGGALLVAVLIWFGYWYVRGHFESRPRKIERYAEVSLGDSKEQVLYEKGSPTDVLVVAADVPAYMRGDLEVVKTIPPDKSVTDYAHWEYESADSGRVDVDFSPKTQRVVRVFCYSTEQRECPSLLNIAQGTTEDQVIKALGKPSHAELSTSAKTLTYSQFQVAFYLARRRVYGFELSTGVDLPERSPMAGPKSACLTPPPECALAKTAKECADILERAGKNPLDAYGTEGCEPVYNPASTSSDTRPK